MTMAGGATGGYCEIGSCVIATPPITRMNSAITHAKMGRSMKNLAMDRAPYCADAAEAAGAGADAAPAGALAPLAHGTGLTGAPGTIIFWKPSTMTFSPGFRPSSTSQFVPWAEP